eukprot:4900242-Amphidinium_carterae.1
MSVMMSVIFGKINPGINVSRSVIILASTVIKFGALLALERLTWPPLESMMVDICLACVDADMPVTIQTDRKGRMLDKQYPNASSSEGSKGTCSRAPLFAATSAIQFPRKSEWCTRPCSASLSDWWAVIHTIWIPAGNAARGLLSRSLCLPLIRFLPARNA